MPRIPTVGPDTTPEGSRDLLEQIERASGKAPNIAKTLAHSPAALQAWYGLSGALASTLTPELREQISIAVAEANGCAYCLSAHTAVGGMVGLDAEELALARDGASHDERRAAALQFALAVLETRGSVSNDALERVRKAGFDDGEIAELVAHVALNVLTNYFNHVARLEIDSPVVEPRAARAA